MASEKIQDNQVEIIDANTGLVTTVNAAPILKDNGAGTMVFDFASMSREAGLSSVPLQSLQKLSTDDVVNTNLTIDRVEIAQAMTPAGQTVLYPVVHFAEFADSYYGGGGMLTNNVQLWCKAAMDEWKPGIPVNLNEKIAEAGGIGVRLTVKESKRNAGQDYVMVSFL